MVRARTLVAVRERERERELYFSKHKYSFVQQPDTSSVYKLIENKINNIIKKREDYAKMSIDIKQGHNRLFFAC